MTPKMPKNTDMSVDVRTGAFEYHAVDLVIPARGFDFRIERWHSSFRYFSDWYGWRFDWDERLEFDEGDGSIRHYAPGDRLSRFVSNEDGTYSPAVEWVHNSLEVLPGGLYAVRFPSGNRSEFGATGRLQRRVDPYGNTMSFFWDAANRQIQRIVDAAGRELNATWEDENRRLRLTDWTGRELVYTFEGAFEFLNSYRDPEGNLTRYTRSGTFDGLASIQVPSGEVWVRNYSFAGVPRGTMVGRQLFANGRAREFVYDQPNRVTVVSESSYEWRGGEPVLGERQRPWSYSWDESGNLVQKTSPLGSHWTYQYNAANQVTRIDDPAPRLTCVETSYDARGNLLSRRNQKGDTWTYEYHPTFPKVTKITGPAPFHRVTRFTYDNGTGALLEQQDPMGRRTTYEYFPDGLLKQVTPPGASPKVTKFEYDEFGHLVRVENGLGQATTFQHDPVGNQVSSTDPLGRTTSRQHDRLGRVTQASSPLGNSTRMAYDGNGNVVTVTDPLNRGTRFEYGPMDELMRVVDPAGGVVSYSYDLFHNLARQVDPNGHAYQFEYDDMDRQVRVVDPMGQVTTVEHPPDCGTTVTTDAEGHQTSLYRDVTCLVTERAFSDGSAFAFTYDSEGRRVSATSTRAEAYGTFLYGSRTYGPEIEETIFGYDAGNHLTSITYPGQHTLGFTWDEAGRLASLTDLHGTVLTYGYDAGNRLTTVTRAGKTTTYQYDGAGQLARLAYPNGVTCTFAYDDDSRLTRMLWEKEATLLYYLEYRYDRAGNRTRRKVTRSPEAAVLEDFNYDALSRLVRVDENGSLRAHYKYDPAGNRLLKKRPPQQAPEGALVDSDELYEYDASDELVAMNSTRFRWDRVGQLVEKDDPAQANPTRYEWNGAHRLARVTLPDLTAAEYRYNGDELRTWRREPSGAETNYYWVPSGILGLSQLLNETDGTGAPKANYVLGPNGLIAIIDGDGHERYYLFDALGSVLALTDERGAVTDTYAYDEYGLEISATGTSYNPMRYTGQQWDGETQQYYLRHRLYAPGSGKFVSRDPLEGSRRYVYVNNNPENLIDPQGMKGEPPPFGGIDPVPNNPSNQVLFGIPSGSGNYAFIGVCYCPEGYLVTGEVTYEFGAKFPGPEVLPSESERALYMAGLTGRDGVIVDDSAYKVTCWCMKCETKDRVPGVFQLTAPGMFNIWYY